MPMRWGRVVEVVLATITTIVFLMFLGTLIVVTIDWATIDPAPK